MIILILILFIAFLMWYFGVKEKQKQNEILSKLDDDDLDNLHY